MNIIILTKNVPIVNVMRRKRRKTIEFDFFYITAKH